ncbi:MAG: hypothetical protein NNA31_09870 [Nitrospira sp.]|nr:hypothetical protein [Nitrospira sp.]
MSIFQGLLFMPFGAGLVLVDYRALRSGWLPCGPNGFRGRLEFGKHEQPVGFWVMFVLYGTGGLWLPVFVLPLR